MARERNYSAALKAQLVLDVLTGHKTVSGACRQRAVSEPLFYEWQAEFLAHSARVFAKEEQLAAAEARVAELERLVGRLLLELEGANKRAGSVANNGAHNERWR